jgi:hypothetical protein
MIKTTFGQLAILRAPQPGQIGIGTLTRLATIGVETKFAHRIQISRFLRPVVEVIQAYEKSFMELVQSHSDKISSGNFKLRDAERITYEDELLALHNVEVEVAVLPLPQSVLESSPLTPQDLMLLEDAGLVVLKPTALDD